tara:strand:+ start:1457 stop:1759 length:303 start_codon:yes stop_codon:yes gene_type:complete
MVVFPGRWLVEVPENPELSALRTICSRSGKRSLSSPLRRKRRKKEKKEVREKRRSGKRELPALSWSGRGLTVQDMCSKMKDEMRLHVCVALHKREARVPV